MKRTETVSPRPVALEDRLEQSFVQSTTESTAHPLPVSRVCAKAHALHTQHLLTLSLKESKLFFNSLKGKER